MNESSELIRDIERFRDRHRFSDAGVSRMLTGNPGFLDRLRKGGDVYSKTEKRIRREMKEHDVKIGSAT